MANLLEVFDATEIHVSIGTYDDTGSEWTYETVKFKRNVNPEIPNNDRAVYDGITYIGSKKQRSENTLAIDSEFQGFGQGLLDYENEDELLVKLEIIPNEGSLPDDVDAEQYFYNWNTGDGTYSIGDEGEIIVTLDGRFASKHLTEPTDNVDWEPSA